MERESILASAEYISEIVNTSNVFVVAGKATGCSCGWRGSMSATRNQLL